MLAVCLTLILMTSCTTVVASDCAWVRQITVNDADEITRPTAEQIVAHNRKVAEFCR
jgi:hypothetical protein